MQNERIEALYKHLTEEGETVSRDEISESTHDEKTLEHGGAEYLVVTDDEADELAAGYINESVWAFNSDFIIQHSSVLDFDKASEAILEAIREQCESGNEAMKKLIDDMQEFVSDAVSTDGRAHFLSTYDGKENRVEVDGEDYFIYRTN